MVGFSSSPGPRGGGVVSASARASKGYDVHNKGVLVGGPDGATGTALLANGPLTWESPHGLDGAPLIRIRPILTEIATGTIDLAGGVQQLDVMGEIEDATVLYVELRKFSALPQAGFQGGFYLWYPATGVDPSAQAALIPWTTTWAEAQLGFPVVKKDLAPPQRRRISTCFWIPKVKSTVAATAEYGVYAMPKWYKTWHGGPVKLKGEV